jgi:hypothetical protein
MNKLIDWLISSLKYMIKKNKLYIIAFYNKTCFLINKNSTLSKIYKPIIEEKVITNKNLKQSLKAIDNKNKETENNILKLQKKNELLEDKISIIQNLITKRHD